MFGLIDVQPVEGAIKIPVHCVMSNDTIVAIIQRRISKIPGKGIKDMTEAREYLKSLENDPDAPFVDPGVNCEDCFVLSFGWY